jgi:hypothetical protein
MQYQAALRFLQLLTGTVETVPRATFTTLRNGQPGKPWYDRRLDDVYPTLAALNRTGSDVYFTVNVTDGQGRTAEHVTAARALFVDYDTGVPTHWDVAPSLVVESSPGKAQAYWLLQEPCTDLARWQAANRSLVAQTGGDPNACDLARILRVPGFVNHKYPPERPVVKIKRATGARIGITLLEMVYPPALPTTSGSATVGVAGATSVPEHERQRRYQAWLAAAGRPPAAGTGLRSWLFRKAAAGVRDFALTPNAVADALIQIDGLDDAADLTLLYKIAKDADRYGQREVGAALGKRQPAKVRVTE